MHEPMYDHPGVGEAIDRVESWGVFVCPARVEEGKAKIASIDAIALATARAANDHPLAGRTWWSRAVRPRESIDPVRVLTNRSSGKTGQAVARACYVRGAAVTLVHDGPDVPYADVEPIESAAEMLAAVEGAVEDADALVSAAAIGDYTVETSPEKIRSGQEDCPSTSNPPRRCSIRSATSHPELSIVGFKTETSGDDAAMVEAARNTLSRANLSFVVANDASVMGEDRTRALVVRESDFVTYEGDKSGLGARVADELAIEL